MPVHKHQRAATAAIAVIAVLAVLAVLYLPAGDHRREAEPATSAAPADPDLVRLAPDQIQAGGIATAEAGPGVLRPYREFPGEIRFNADRLAHVVPRVAGIVERVPADLGQPVRKGQVLAVIASTTLSDLRSELLAARKRAELARQTYERERGLWEARISAQQEYLQARAAHEESLIAVDNAMQKLAAIGASPAAAALNQFELRAPFDGVVVEKHMTPGEAVGATDQAFTIADLDTVWAEFVVAPRDLDAVRVGERVSIGSSALRETAAGRVSYVGPLLGDQTRTATARVTLRNPGAAWRPGLFITVRLLEAEQPVPVAVPMEAVQSVNGESRVFVAAAGGFRAAAVETGRSDGTLVEIVAGLAPGTRYAAANTFTLKAELGKGEAGHAH